jgi:hypothetical protein
MPSASGRRPLTRVATRDVSVPVRYVVPASGLPSWRAAALWPPIASAIAPSSTSRVQPAGRASTAAHQIA